MSDSFLEQDRYGGETVIRFLDRKIFTGHIAWEVCLLIVPLDAFLLPCYFQCTRCESVENCSGTDAICVGVVC